MREDERAGGRKGRDKEATREGGSDGETGGRGEATDRAPYRGGGATTAREGPGPVHAMPARVHSLQLRQGRVVVAAACAHLLCARASHSPPPRPCSF